MQELLPVNVKKGENKGKPPQSPQRVEVISLTVLLSPQPFSVCNAEVMNISICDALYTCYDTRCKRAAREGCLTLYLI